MAKRGGKYEEDINEYEDNKDNVEILRVWYLF